MQAYQNLSSVMAQHSHENVSDKYSFVPSVNVINLLENNGWFVNDARETNARQNKGFQKHIIRFRQEKYRGHKLELEEIIPEAIMMNAHDGTSRFVFMSGLERCWCSNQCTVSEGVIRSHKVTHRGYTDEKILDAVYNIVEETPKVLDSINNYKDVHLTDDEKIVFGDIAMDLLYEPVKWSKFDKDKSVARLLVPERKQDEDSNLWNVFNTVQEKFLKGGRYMISNDDVAYSKRHDFPDRTLYAVKTKKIKSIDRDVKLNRALWSLTERMNEIKQASK